MHKESACHFRRCDCGVCITQRNTVYIASMIRYRVHTHPTTQDITSWYHMVTHFYQAAWSPTRAFPLPGIHWGKEASVTQCEHTAAIVCPTLWCHGAFASNTDSQWEDLEQRKPWSEVRSGLCHGLVTHTHMPTTQHVKAHATRRVHCYDRFSFLLHVHAPGVVHMHTQVHTHTHLRAVWGHSTCAQRYGDNLWSVYF